MGLIAIGDIHGRSAWKKILEKESFDKAVFVGDYFDAHEDITPEEEITNFKALMELKEREGDRVILLFGNHDLHYHEDIKERYSRYIPDYASVISELIHQVLSFSGFQMAFHHNGILFTHAGVTKTWCRNAYGKDDFSGDELVKKLNGSLYSNPEIFHFTPGKKRNPWGNEVTQSPVWVRPRSLIKDRLDGFTQVVGHTKLKKLKPGNEIVFIDTLGTSGEYLVIEDDGELYASKV